MAADRVELRTIYLVDLVGSTRLAASVGPARADEIRAEFFGVLRDAADATGGEPFKNTGDGLFVAFASASAAVACAVLTHQLLERRSRGAEHPLHARIGLGTGESTIQDGDFFGMPSIEAARLCDKAPADGILVSPATRMLAGRVEGARFEAAGTLELKGLPEPMDAFAVLWEPLDPERPGDGLGRWPLPDALRTVPPTSYVGRAAERARLEEAGARARAGLRQIILLAGEPGIGKTRLAANAALAANADGFAVCWGACSEDLAAPYEPWIGVCAQLVEHLDDATLATYVERFGGDIRRIAPGLVRRVPTVPEPRSADPETERLLLFNAVAGLLRAAADAVPVCAVLDDFHWADGQSVSLLRHVARSVETSALQLLVTYRDSDLARADPLTAVLADLRRVTGVQRIALGGLDRAEIAELLQAVAGHELGDDGRILSAELAAETGGNPFFVGEILRSLTESGSLAQDAGSGRWRLARTSQFRLPESVRDVVDRRVDRLGDDGREVLAAAAVVGRTFDAGLLPALVDVKEGRVLDLLDAAAGASLVRETGDPVGRFTFEHALINQALYDGIGATRRARLHRRIAEALERHLGADPGARVGELAGHWAKADPPDRTKAIGYAQRAGDRALRELAPDEALPWFARAGALLRRDDDPRVRADVLIGLGEAQRRTGDAAYRQTLLDAAALASELRDGERAVRAALANHRGQTSVMGQVDRERIAAIERALELDDDPDRRARLLAIQATELLYEEDPAHRLAIADEALALARTLRTPTTTAAVLDSWFRVHSPPGGLAGRRAHLDEFAAAAEATGDPVVGFWSALLVRNALIQGGEVERARELFARSAAIAERLDEPSLHWSIAVSACCFAQLHGDLDEADRLAHRAFEAGRLAREPDAPMFFGGQLIPVRIVQGRAAEIIDLLEDSIRANPRITGFSAAKAQILCGLGRTAEAAAIVSDAAADGFARVPWEQTRGVTLAMFAEAAAQAGVTGAAAVLYELVVPAADQIIWNGANTLGHTATYAGLLATTLGRHAEADAHFARAIEVQEREGLRVWTARAQLGWAEALVARGEDDRAREHAGRALALSRAHGYALFEPRAAAITEGRSATSAGRRA